MAETEETAREIAAAAYLAHSEALRRRMIGLTRDAAVAEDLVQEAFLRLLEEAARGAVPDNVGGWLNRVATNAFISRARHTQVVNRTAARLPRPTSDPSPEDEFEWRETARSIHAAMGDLARDDQAAILLAAGGSSGREIASALGRSELAARALLSRARARLRLRVAAAEA